MRKLWSEMTMHERCESIHPAKMVAALKAQIDNLEFELSKIPIRKKLQGRNEFRHNFTNHIIFLKKKLKIAEQELNKIMVIEK